MIKVDSKFNYLSKIIEGFYG